MIRLLEKARQGCDSEAKNGLKLAPRSTVAGVVAIYEPTYPMPLLSVFAVVATRPGWARLACKGSDAGPRGGSRPPRQESVHGVHDSLATAGFVYAVYAFRASSQRLLPLAPCRPFQANNAQTPRHFQPVPVH